MSENIKKILDAPISFWKKQTKKNKIIISSILGGLLVVSILSAWLLNMPKYSILYPGLDRDEAIEVMGKLDEREIHYKEENGTIKVPKEQEAALRMDLSSEGHPRTAPNYDFFLKNIDIMTTDMEKKIINNYQLNQRLEEVIKSIDSIKNASVTINVPEDTGYVLSDKSKTKVTAGVALTVQKGKELTNEQVSGIKRLIAKSVPNLSEEDVVVVDTASGEELDASTYQQVDLVKLKLDIASQMEKDITNKIMKILTPIYGQGNVQIAVTSVVDIDKRIQEVITYQPSENNKGVISEEQKTAQGTRDGKAAAGGIPGMDSNAEIPTYPGITVDNNTIYIKNDQTYKYLVSQIKEQIQRDSGQLKDQTISVVINEVGINEEKKTQLTRLVANAAAILPEKVMIYTEAFEQAATPVTGENDKSKIPNKNLIIIFIIFAAIAVITVIIMMLVLKKRKSDIDQLENELEESQMIREQDGEEGQSDTIEIDKIPEITGTKEQAYKKQIQEFTKQNPEIAAQLIRSWLRGDDTDD